MKVVDNKWEGKGGGGGGGMVEGVMGSKVVERRNRLNIKRGAIEERKVLTAMARGRRA